MRRICAVLAVLFLSLAPPTFADDKEPSKAPASPIPSPRLSETSSRAIGSSMPTPWTCPAKTKTPSARSATSSGSAVTKGVKAAGFAKPMDKGSRVDSRTHVFGDVRGSTLLSGTIPRFVQKRTTGDISLRSTTAVSSCSG